MATEASFVAPFVDVCDGKKPSDEALAAGVQVAKALSKTPEEVARMWEVWAINHDLDEVSPEQLRKMLVAAKQAMARSRLKNARSRRSSQHHVKRLRQTTPPTNSKHFATTPHKQNNSPPVSSLEFERAVVKSVCTLNSHLPLAVPATATKLINMDVSEVSEWPPARYMHEPLAVRAETLKKRVETFRSELEKLMDAQVLGYPKTSIDDVGTFSHDSEIFCVGTVSCETVTGNLNEKSISLEGANGLRTHLDLSKCKSKSYALFPGKVVGVRGLAPTGSEIVVEEIYDLPRLEPVKRTPEKRVSPTPRPNLTIKAACGPFYAISEKSPSVDFTILESLLSETLIDSNHLLILYGPFVPAKAFDSAPPRVEFNNRLEYKSVDTILLAICFKICARLSKDSSIPTKVVLVPAIDDLASTSPSFPQRGLEINYKRLAKDFPNVDVQNRIRAVANPCRMKIDASDVDESFGDVSVEIANVDVLADLSTQLVEYTSAFDENQERKFDSAPVRMMRLSDALLRSKSMYPIFPPVSDDVCLSLESLQTRDSAPDVVVAPSKLAPFAGVAKNGTLFVNPGKLLSGRRVFATLTVLPPRRAKPGVESLQAAHLSEWTRVDFGGLQQQQQQQQQQ